MSLVKYALEALNEALKDFTINDDVEFKIQDLKVVEINNFIRKNNSIKITFANPVLFNYSSDIFLALSRHKDFRYAKLSNDWREISVEMHQNKIEAEDLQDYQFEQIYQNDKNQLAYLILEETLLEVEKAEKNITQKKHSNAKDEIRIKTLLRRNDFETNEELFHILNGYIQSISHLTIVRFLASMNLQEFSRIIRIRDIRFNGDSAYASIDLMKRHGKMLLPGFTLKDAQEMVDANHEKLNNRIDVFLAHSFEKATPTIISNRNFLLHAIFIRGNQSNLFLSYEIFSYIQEYQSFINYLLTQNNMDEVLARVLLYAYKRDNLLFDHTITRCQYTLLCMIAGGEARQCVEYYFNNMTSIDKALEILSSLSNASFASLSVPNQELFIFELSRDRTGQLLNSALDKLVANTTDYLSLLTPVIGEYQKGRLKDGTPASTAMLNLLQKTVNDKNTVPFTKEEMIKIFILMHNYMTVAFSKSYFGNITFEILAQRLTHIYEGLQNDIGVKNTSQPSAALIIYTKIKALDAENIRNDFKRAFEEEKSKYSEFTLFSFK